MTAVDASSLRERLAAGEFVPISPGHWPSLQPLFHELERHDTSFAGDLVLLEWEGGFAGLEQPADSEWLLRPLKDREAAGRFIRHRLEQYERMWDGCGCRIDYRAADF